MTSVLVTGGAGYVGLSLVRSLLRHDGVDEVVVYDNLNRRNHAFFQRGTVDGGGRVRFVEGDILDGRTLDGLTESVDLVYHLAAHVTTPNSDGESHTFDQVNNWGSAQVARSIEKSDRVQRAVYLSSMAVYGSGDEIFDEMSRPAPASMYGISKLRGEAHFQRLADREIHVVRAGNVYGFSPTMRFDAVVNKFAFEARFRRRVTIHGSGEQSRPFVQVDRLGDALALLVSPGLPAGVHNAADHNRSVLDLVDDLRSEIEDLEVLFVDQDMRMREMRAEVPGSLLVPLGEPSPFADGLRDLLHSMEI